ncbi:hypothetical protein B7P43_G15300 [Cryptotermes secundus]|uniref:Mos1 transposase HTH domain-containing protein n=1 Tax=Cryptotermes secundus TaxID=105785 RepID=A0A2J7PIS6_9NEOP|nr:hypothetical protein B7P43_G15300 [Cryptotermes secundus]
MTERLEQRYCIKFCQELGDTQAETIRKIQQALGCGAVGVTQIKEWFNRFKHAVADEAGISRGSANRILTEDFGMRSIAAKFVPKLLSPGQQQLHLEVTQDMLEFANRDPEFLKTVFNGDEWWVYVYDPETKVQVPQWKHPTSPRPKKHDRFGAM